MANECSHSEYYEGITEGLSLRSPLVTVEDMEKDPHLNHISLNGWWDDVAISYYPILKARFESVGDFLSLAGAVCAVKHMARRQAISVAKERVVSN